MSSTSSDSCIAWILSSFNQQAIAQSSLDVTYKCYSSLSRITYTFGRRGLHDIVIACPAFTQDVPTAELIIGELLQHAPSIKVGFLISSNAFSTEGGAARVGDVVVGGQLPDLDQGVLHFDAEKTTRQKSLFITRQSGHIPDVVVAAVNKLRSLEGRNSWLQDDSKDALVLDQPPDTARNNRPPSAFPIETQPRVLYAVIGSSEKQIDDKDLIRKLGRECICFETVAATMKSRPLVVLAGIARHCGHDQVPSADKRACKAVISYLGRLLFHMDRDKLQDEPRITDYLEYEPFDLDRSGCRLLRLEGGTGQLHCHVFQTYLPPEKSVSSKSIDDDTMLIPYEAVSYCWGSSQLTNTVHVNGKLLRVTSNLFEALEYLRYPRADRILWIDAICIDQSNASERGHQVNLMGRLYSHAEEVLIWLGDLGGGMASLISVLQIFQENLPREARAQWTSDDPRLQETWKSIRDTIDDQYTSLRLSLELLIKHPWFGRVWIIQEVAKARKASLGCTQGWIDATIFAFTPKLLQVEPNTQCQAIIDIMPGSSRRFSWFKQKPNISTLLWRFRDSRASDPRDKLYALLGISSDAPVATDYTKTEEALVGDIKQYLLQDKASICNVHVSHMQGLQTELPRLLGLALQQHILGGATLDEVKQFASRHTKPAFLSEATVGYLSRLRSPILTHYMYRSLVVDVIARGPQYELEFSQPSGSPQALSIPRVKRKASPIPLDLFLESKKAKTTKQDLDSSPKNGLNNMSRVTEVEQERDDI